MTLNQTMGRAIEAQKDGLAKLIVDEQWARHPQFYTRHGVVGHVKCIQGVKHSLAYLAEAIASDSLALFTVYIDWVKVLFEGLKIPSHELAENLEIMSAVLQQHFPESTVIIKNFTDMGLTRLASEPKIIPSFFVDSQPLSSLGRQYLKTLRRGERFAASQLILDAVTQGTSIKDIYLHVFQPSQYEIGRLWQMNQMSVAQEHYCTAATQLIMSQLYVHIFNAKRNGHHLVATGVGGELHEIGLRMVADFFEMDGWDTYYLGSNTPAVNVVQALKERQADVLAISVTMTFHIKLVAELIAQVRAVDSLRQIKILVGGYPFNIEPELWQKVGADGHAINAEQAITTANMLMTTR